jgi:hypothetical protein
MFAGDVGGGLEDYAERQKDAADQNMKQMLRSEPVIKRRLTQPYVQRDQLRRLCWAVSVKIYIADYRHLHRLEFLIARRNEQTLLR